MDFTSALSRAARLYGAVTLASIVLLFVGVETWRGIEYISTNVGPQATGSLRAVIALVYLVATGTEVATARGARYFYMAYYFIALLTVLLSTGALYGLLTFVARLIPGLPDYDPLFVACLTMAVVLGAHVIFHRRTHR